MTGRQKIIVAIAGAHLLLVAYHSAVLPMPLPGNPAVDAVRWYGAMSGANNSYGFFKQVGSSVKVTFTLLNKEGETFEDQLSQDDNREIQLRLNSGANLLDDNYSEAVMLSWAAMMFGRHPEATLVRVHIWTFDPGTMTDYREGKRPEWIDRTAGQPKIYNRTQVTEAQ